MNRWKIYSSVDTLESGRKKRLEFAIRWAGLCLIVIFWLCNWTIPGLRTHWGFFPLWLGYCLFVSTLTSARKKSSLLMLNYRAYLGLFLISMPLWWLFELINLRTQNWLYQGKEYFSSAEFFLLSSLSFSVVTPAVFSTAELVETFAWVKKLTNGPRFILRRGTWQIILGTGLVMMLLIVAWPRYYYPLVWGAVYLIVESINLKRGYRTLLAYLSRGDWRQVVALALGSLICGFFWELWNYYSYPKWIYNIPYADVLHVFEMPLPGYVGYIPFALELFALYHFAIGIAGMDRLNNYLFPEQPE